MSDHAAIVVDRLWKKYSKSLRRSMLYGLADLGRGLCHLPAQTGRLRRAEFWALQDISFELRRGEWLGVIGANGAGKSTLLKLLSGILPPDRGRITLRGQVSALIELGAGFHPDLSGRENVYLQGAIMGMTRRAIDERFAAIVEFAGIGEFLDTPVKFYSSGMHARLGFSIPIHFDPDILLLDEVLAVGDMSFQEKCMRRMERMRTKDKAVLMVSHSLFRIEAMCDRAMWLDHGRCVMLGDAKAVVRAYLDDEERRYREGWPASSRLPLPAETRPSRLLRLNCSGRRQGQAGVRHRRAHDREDSLSRTRASALAPVQYPRLPGSARHLRGEHVDRRARRRRHRRPWNGGMPARFAAADAKSIRGRDLRPFEGRYRRYRPDAHLCRLPSRRGERRAVADARAHGDQSPEAGFARLRSALMAFPQRPCRSHACAGSVPRASRFACDWWRSSRGLASGSVMNDYLDKNAEYWAASYAAENVESFVFRPYGRIFKYEFGLDGASGQRLLDFGCGEGAALRFFRSKGFDVYGVDISPSAIAKCQTLMPDIADHFQVIPPQPSAEDRFFGGGFDAVIAIQSLYYYSNDDLGVRLRSLYEMTKPRGIVYASMIRTGPLPVRSCHAARKWTLQGRSRLAAPSGS